jgi:hypothetical protein
MTPGDFMLGILTSLIATLLFESRKSWRRIYGELIKGVLLLTSLAERKLTLGRIRLTASAFMFIATAVVFLSQSPKLASDVTVQNTRRPPKVRNRVVMRPCVPEDYSACGPIRPKDDVAMYLGPSSTDEPQLIALYGHSR